MQRRGMLKSFQTPHVRFSATILMVRCEAANNPQGMICWIVTPLIQGTVNVVPLSLGPRDGMCRGYLALENPWLQLQGELSPLHSILSQLEDDETQTITSRLWPHSRWVQMLPRKCRAWRKGCEQVK